MKKNDFIIIGFLLVIAVGISVFTRSVKTERTVRKLLGKQVDEIVMAKKVMGGREPIFGAIVAYDGSRSAELCKSLGLFEETSHERRKDTLSTMQSAFGHEFLASTNAQIFIGSLKTDASFMTEAV